MKVSIFTESGRKTGFGHLSRCLALFQAFKERGIPSRLYINGDDSVTEVFKGIDYSIVDWLDRKNYLRILKKTDIAIVDSYIANLRFQHYICKFINLPVYIEDLLRLIYTRNVVINSNLYAPKLYRHTKNGVYYLLGTRFVPLRREFWTVQPKVISKEVKSLMVTFGGSDVRGLTAKTLDFLIKTYPQIHKNIVIGRGFKNIGHLERMRQFDKNIHFVYFPDALAMKCLMLNSDIAISSGGQTLYELARVGIPTIGICFIDNQELNLKTWQQAGGISYIGWYNRKSLFNELGTAIENLRNFHTRFKFYKILRHYVDGQGARRVVDYLINRCSYQN